MENEQKYKWRIAARAVPFFDLTTLIIATVAAVAFTYFYINPSEYISKPVELIQTLTGERFSVVTIITCLFIFIWLIVLLMAATRRGVDRNVALEKAQDWYNIQYYFFLFALIFNIFQHAYLPFGIAMIVRAIFLGIVSNYIKELKGV